MCGKEREKERERDREKEREKVIEKERGRERKRKKKKEKEREREREKERKRESFCPMKCIGRRRASSYIFPSPGVQRERGEKTVIGLRDRNGVEKRGGHGENECASEQRS